MREALGGRADYPVVGRSSVEFWSRSLIRLVNSEGLLRIRGDGRPA